MRCSGPFLLCVCAVFFLLAFHYKYRIIGTMSAGNERKIQKLLDQHQPGTVCLAAWLDGLGISHGLQKRYRRSGWLTPIGKGAFIRPDDVVRWQGGLYALQAQARLPIHAGAITALSMHGMAHYVRLGAETIFLFASPRTLFPAWFKNYDWGADIQLVRTSVLPKDVGVVEYDEKSFSIRISTPERAMLECLYLAPARMDVVECSQVMEGLTTLRPGLLQSLLEECNSIKVKRLFLYLADRAGHDWMKRLDITRLELGSGDRTITKGGVYVAKFGITVPQELVRT